MSINIYKDRMQKAQLFGASVLYSRQPIPREDVPLGWYCYDLCGTAEDPEKAYRLVDQAEKNHSGSILSHLPLKNGQAQSRLVKDKFELTCVSVSLKKFCADERIDCPETPLRHMLYPASQDEAGLFYAQTPERDEELGAIGHVRIDFGHGGNEGLYHTWWPRGPKELNTQEFRDELDKVVNDLRQGVLKDLSSDLVIRYDGREWVSEDWTKMESFRNDPVVAEAVEQIQQALEQTASSMRQQQEMGGMTFV